MLCVAHCEGSLRRRLRHTRTRHFPNGKRTRSHDAWQGGKPFASLHSHFPLACKSSCHNKCPSFQEKTPFNRQNATVGRHRTCLKNGKPSEEPGEEPDHATVTPEPRLAVLASAARNTMTRSLISHPEGAAHVHGAYDQLS